MSAEVVSEHSARAVCARPECSWDSMRRDCGSWAPGVRGARAAPGPLRYCEAMRGSTVFRVLVASVFACACGTAAPLPEPELPAAAAVDEEPPPPPELAGVELRLAVEPLVWDTGTVPAFALTFVNRSRNEVRIGSPIEGSWNGLRSPGYVLEMIDESGGRIADAIGPPPALCATIPHFQAGIDDTVVAPGGEADAFHSPNAAPWIRPVLSAARPGKYMARIRYIAPEAPLTAMTAVSNPVAVEIRGGNMAMWTCYRELIEQQAADRKLRREVTLRPTDVVAVADGFAAVYLREEMRRVDDMPTYVQTIGVQLVRDSGPHGEPVVIPDATLGRAVAGDQGIFLVVARPGDDGETPQKIWLQRRGARLIAGDPEPLAPNLVAYFGTAWLAISRSGDVIAVAYQHMPGRERTELAVQTFSARDGAKLGGPEVLGTSDNNLHGLDLAPAAGGGFHVAWVDRTGAHAARLDASGRARGAPLTIASPMDTLHAVSAWGSGYALAYFATTSYGGQGSGPTQGFFLSEYDGRGEPRGAPLDLSPSAYYDERHADFVRVGDAAVWAYNPPRMVEGQAPATLLLRRTGGEPRKISDDTLGPVHLAARADTVAVAWSDTRHDRSRACVKARECVGEAYVAVYRGDAPVLGPTRLTRASVPAAYPSFAAERWEALCP